MIDSSWRNFHAVNFERIKQDIHNDKSPTTIPLDGLNELVLSGYGFASSAFSSCFILFRNTTQYFSPVSIEDSRVVCDFSNLDLPPGYYDIGFSQGGLVEECCFNARKTVATSRLMLSEMALYFDGVDDFVTVPDIISVPSVVGEDNDGFRAMTFGTWFFPTTNATLQQQPIICLIGECSSEIPLLQVREVSGYSVEMLPYL